MFIHIPLLLVINAHGLLHDLTPLSKVVVLFAFMICFLLDVRSEVNSILDCCYLLLTATRNGEENVVHQRCDPLSRENQRRSCEGPTQKLKLFFASLWQMRKHQPAPWCCGHEKSITHNKNHTYDIITPMCYSHCLFYNMVPPIVFVPPLYNIEHHI